MQQDLKERWDVKALTLYDRAPSWIFRPLSIEEKHDYLQHLVKSLEQNIDGFPVSSLEDIPDADSASEISMFSYRDANMKVHFRSTRPLLIVSCTSWTPDEDFGILLDALKEYEKHAIIANAASSSPSSLPKILVVITGKGPQKNYYKEKIALMQGMQYVRIATAWLAAEDYPKILASADLGVSLHTSTSGLDLPMKVVDMYGCHLPVLAKRFKAIGELVVDDSTGVLFDSPTELKQGIVRMTTGFPTHCRKLDAMRKNVKQRMTVGWEEQWNAAVWPLIQSPSVEHDARETKRWERFQSGSHIN